MFQIRPQTPGRSATVPVTRSAVDRKGLYRRAGGTWKHLTTASSPFTGKNSGGALAWATGTPTVWAIDPVHGLFRSTDAGLTWRKILAVTSSASGVRMLAVDPTDAATVVIATTGKTAGLWRVTVPKRGPAIGTRLAADAAPGPVAISANGTTVGLTTGQSASLLVAPPGAQTAATTSEQGLTACCALPVTLAISTYGSLLVGSNAAGATVGTPSTG